MVMDIFFGEFENKLVVLMDMIEPMSTYSRENL